MTPSVQRGSIYRSRCPFVGLSVSLSVGLSVSMSVSMAVAWRAPLSLYPSLSLSLCLNSLCSLLSALCSLLLVILPARTLRHLARHSGPVADDFRDAASGGGRLPAEQASGGCRGARREWANGESRDKTQETRLTKQERLGGLGLVCREPVRVGDTSVINLSCLSPQGCSCAHVHPMTMTWTWVPLP